MDKLDAFPKNFENEHAPLSELVETDAKRCEDWTEPSVAALLRVAAPRSFYAGPVVLLDLAGRHVVNPSLSVDGAGVGRVMMQARPEVNRRALTALCR